MRKGLRGGITAGSLSLIILAGLPISAQKIDVLKEDAHGVVGPVSSMAFGTLTQANETSARPRLASPVANGSAAQGEDSVVQEIAGPMVAATPGLSFMGLGLGFPGFTVQYAPPDTNAAVGATQIVEVVNLSFAVFNKASGAILKGPVTLNNLFTGVDPSCSNGSNLSDPVVLYDRQAGRWVIEFFTVNSPYKYCWAVSTTNDATGTYNAYAFSEPTGLPDYNKTAVWPDAYYSVGRLFKNGATYIGPRPCAVNRAAMLTGAPATIQCLQINNANIDGMLPSNADGAQEPPAGTPNYYMILGPSGSNTLQLYKFHVDFTTPANSTFTGPTSLAVAAYTPAPSFGGAVPQLGTTNKLDGLGFTLMHRLSYRNFLNTAHPHESLVVTHNVSVGSGTSLRLAPRWYEIRNPSGTPKVYQQGTFSPDTTSRWTASIAMDKVGDMALGYSTSSSTLHPGIRFTGRIPTDAAGTMETEAGILQGNGSQTGGLDRWGDYSSMAIDPVDDCTFWYSQEYISVNGSFNWSTNIASLKFPSCK